MFVIGKVKSMPKLVMKTFYLSYSLTGLISLSLQFFIIYEFNLS